MPKPRRRYTTAASIQTACLIGTIFESGYLSDPHTNMVSWYYDRFTIWVGFMSLEFCIWTIIEETR